MGVICTIVLVLMGYKALGVVGCLMALFTVIISIVISESKIGQKILNFCFEDIDNE